MEIRKGNPFKGVVCVNFKFIPLEWHKIYDGKPCQNQLVYMSFFTSNEHKVKINWPGAFQVAAV